MSEFLKNFPKRKIEWGNGDRHLTSQGVLAGLEFEKVKVYQNLARRIWGALSLNRLKNPWNHQFLIMATKGLKR